MNCSTVSRFNPAIRHARSATLAFSAGAAGNEIDLAFLDSLCSQMRNTGRIVEMGIRLSLSVTTDVAGAAREDLFARALQRVYIADKHGDRVDCSGASLRVLAYTQNPNFLPALTQNLGAGAATTIDVYVPIPIERFNFLSPKDFRWRLVDLRQGRVQIDWSAATVGAAIGNQIAIVSGTAQLYVWAIDEGEDKRMVRTLVRDTQIIASLQTFNVKGLLAGAYQHIGEVGESTAAAPATWATQTINSPTLLYFSIEDSALRHYYSNNVHPRRTAASITPGDTTDPVTRGCTMPIYTPRFRQAITELPVVDGLEWQTSLTFGAGTFTSANGPRMILDAVVDRPEDPCELGGKIITSDGRTVDPLRIRPELVRKMVQRFYGLNRA